MRSRALAGSFAIAAAVAAPIAARAGPDCGRLPHGQNPANDELVKAIEASSARHGVPTEIVKGVGWQESGLQQWRPDGTFVYNTSDCGLGMMQLTGSTAKAFDVDKLKDDWRYNLDAGVQVLRGKWDHAQRTGKVTADPADRAVLENWYYAVAFYYGARNGDYVAKIFAHVAKRPGRLSQLLARPVEITPPERAIAGFAFGKKFRALRGDRWLDEAGNEHKAPTHAATIGDEATLAKLEVLLARGKKALEQKKLGDAAKNLEAIVAADLDTAHKTEAKALLAKLDDEAAKALDDAEAKSKDATPASREAALATARRIARELATRPIAKRAKDLAAELAKSSGAPSPSPSPSESPPSAPKDDPDSPSNE